MYIHTCIYLKVLIAVIYSYRTYTKTIYIQNCVMYVIERIRNLLYHVYKSIELKEGDASADKIPCLYLQAVTHIDSFIHSKKIIRNKVVSVEYYHI